MTPLLLKDVEKHGRMPRSDAAGLCRIGKRMAYRLVDRLSEQGLVVLKSERRRGVGSELDLGKARITTGNARVPFVVRRRCFYAETAKLDAAIAANLKELGYGS